MSRTLATLERKLRQLEDQARPLRNTEQDMQEWFSLFSDQERTGLEAFFKSIAPRLGIRENGTYILTELTGGELAEFARWARLGKEREARTL